MANTFAFNDGGSDSLNQGTRPDSSNLDHVYSEVFQNRSISSGQDSNSGRVASIAPGGCIDFSQSDIFSPSCLENPTALERTSSGRLEPSELIIAGLPVDGDFPPVRPNPDLYSIGHQEPSGSGDKMVVTGPIEDMPTGWNQIIGQLSRVGGWDVSTGNETLSDAIDSIIDEYNRDGKQLKQIVLRSHGYQGTLSIGGHDYDLNDPQVLNQFARLRTSGALANNAQIELQGCNIAAGVDQSYSPNRTGLQSLANVTGAYVEASSQMQRANRFGWTGQVVRFSPQR
ncbi:DUF4347 domain-containing protein [bacterium]|nr:DUF4347 domain-containing protein [bacterium]